MNLPTVRRATEADIEEIVFLLNELGYQTSANTLAVQLRHYSLPESLILIAKYRESNSLVGLASGHVIPLLHQPGFLGRITSLVVSSDSRGSGVGRKLIDGLEMWFAENQCLRYEVTSSEHRKSAHLFYEKLGYKLDEQRFIKLP